MIPRIIPASSRVYYFYILFRPNGIPCYAGKGKGNRWFEHEKMGAKHPNIHLRIEAAAKANRGKPKKSGWWSTEEGLAKQRANNPGHTGYKHSEEALVKIRAARARQAERDRERRNGATA